MAKHECRNRYHGEGAKGGCYFEIDHVKEGVAHLDVGWSCVIVHRKEIPVTWLAELVAIATQHKGGIAGFLRDHGQGDDVSNSYALMCDPAPRRRPPAAHPSGSAGSREMPPSSEDPMKATHCKNCQFYLPLSDGEKRVISNADGQCNLTLPPILHILTLGRSRLVAGIAGCSLGQPIPQEGAQ